VGRPIDDSHSAKTAAHPPARGFLASLCVGLALLCLAPRTAAAFGDENRFSFALVRHGANYDPRPGGLRRLAWELAKRTSIDTRVEPAAVSLADPELFSHPFLVLAGEGELPPFSPAEREALRRYLTHGGFLLVDDASASPGGPFDRSVRRELAAVLPRAPIKPVASSHVLYKTFYLLRGPVGRLNIGAQADGIELSGRLAVVLSPNDLQGAVARDSLGEFSYETEGGGQQREMALRFGVNLAMYALCLDYKDDQVHVPFIMKRRR